MWVGDILLFLASFAECTIFPGDLLYDKTTEHLILQYNCSFGAGIAAFAPVHVIRDFLISEASVKYHMIHIAALENKFHMYSLMGMHVRPRIRADCASGSCQD